MLKKLAITGAVVTAVAGIGLAAPAYADGQGDGPGDVTQVLPIQVCRELHVLDLIHDVLSSHPNDQNGPCVNGPVERDTTNRIVHVDHDHDYGHRHWG